MCELYAKIIAESELLQPALNEIHKFCFQHWSRSRGTCGTGSGAPDILVLRRTMSDVYAVHAGHVTIFSAGGKVRPILSFTELHALTLATHSHVLLVDIIDEC